MSLAYDGVRGTSSINRHSGVVQILFDNHKFRDNITGSVVSFYVVVEVSVVFVREAMSFPTWFNSSTDFTTAADQPNLTTDTSLSTDF